MTTKPIVAVVGRPNVGKSTFFNKVVGKRVSIVQDIPGVTRDRIMMDAEWCGKAFTLVDTGGIAFGKDDDPMLAHIVKQAKVAIEAADVIVFFLDYKTGVVADDYALADTLRRAGKPVILAVNKMDTFRADALYEYYELGLGDPFGVSAEQSTGLGDLLDEV
ncbi:MAG: 50S ribosome-binding GTPase, partial [Clostridiales bacterium]|nr:50S ribosome-binding GTPase [Clostridiales bacterium]